jgi:hypothetical protein
VGEVVEATQARETKETGDEDDVMLFACHEWRMLPRSRSHHRTSRQAG